MRAHLPDLEAVRALDDARVEKLAAYAELLRDFNRHLNLVSREASDAIETVHIPHCLSLLMKPFPPGSRLVDFGTGGGLPAVPLAIALPETTICAIDVVEKKILAVRSMARRLGLTNLETWVGDAASWSGTAAYAVSRAVAPLSTLWGWYRAISFGPPTPAEAWRPGLLCLKGGDLEGEIAALHRDSENRGGIALHVELMTLSETLQAPYFRHKVIVHVHEQANTRTR